MKEQDIDLIKELEEFEAKAKSIDEATKLYRSRVLELQNQLQLSELSVREAEQRVKSAEEFAQLATENYQKAIALQEGQYEHLIRDLFEQPQRNLIHQMRVQSKRSNNRTVSVALISIILSSITSFAISIYFQNQSSASSQALIEKMNRTLSSVESIEGSTQYAMENIWATEPNFKSLLRVIYENRNEFSSYETENYLALAYKLRISWVASNAKYDEILRAFRAAGITKHGPDQAKLKQWDSEWSSLCQNAVETIKTLKGDVAIEDQERLIGRFKTGSDATDYLGWRWTSPKTNSELLNTYQAELTRVQERIRINTENTK